MDCYVGKHPEIGNASIIIGLTGPAVMHVCTPSAMCTLAWYSLPCYICNSQSVNSFKTALKTSLLMANV